MEHDLAQTNEVRRGRLTTEEKAQIERLAEQMREPSPGAIARRLYRNPATVAWYMIRQGLIKRSITYSRSTHTTQAGLTRHAWTPQEDRRLLELRRSGLSYKECAETITREFGVARKTHTCNVRAVLLAAYDNGEESLG